ncbi:MAG: class I SAM-dependent methyltransferase [candidate division WOR-3 bacterium]|nr:class I SAM-dependent methyltransferase [candidate division WOR-3 bacterium]
MDNYIRFYKEVGKKLPEEYITYSHPGARIRERFIKDNLKEFQGTILDIGCGSGRLTEDRKVVGIDLSLEKLSRAKKRNKKGAFILGDIEGPLFIKENSFQSVLLSEVLEHLRNYNDTMKKIFSLMKPGGEILITTPHQLRKKIEFFSTDLLKSFGIEKGITGEKYIHRNFSKKELETILKKAGLRILEIGTIENELRGWGKIALIFRKFSRIYLKISRCYLNSVYNFLSDTGLIKIQKMLFKEGVRLFAIAEKPK